jgi:voltage-gated potassium channel
MAREHNHGYLIFMLALSLVAMVGLVVELTTDLTESTRQILEFTDTVICVFFFADFCLLLWRAENRWKYLATWGWLDLLSSLPMLDAARWGRAARIFRIVRVLRAIRSARVLTNFFLERRGQSALMGSVFIALLVVMFSAVLVLKFEKGAEGANIKTAEDALWWCVVTMATVGYGDKFPVTTEGRLVACVIMTVGIGLFSVFSGYLASVFLGAQQIKEEEDDVKILRREVAEIKDLLKSQDKKS